MAIGEARPCDFRPKGCLDGWAEEAKRIKTHELPTSGSFNACAGIVTRMGRDASWLCRANARSSPVAANSARRTLATDVLCRWHPVQY